MHIEIEREYTFTFVSILLCFIYTRVICYDYLALLKFYNLQSSLQKARILNGRFSDPHCALEDNGELSKENLITWLVRIGRATTMNPSHLWTSLKLEGSMSQVNTADSRGSTGLKKHTNILGISSSKINFPWKIFRHW